MSAHLSCLTDVDFLYEAWKKVHVKKGSAGMDNVNIDAFEADLDNQLEQLASDFKNECYSPQVYYSFTKEKEEGGSRHIVIATIRDRVAMHAFTNLIYPLFENYFHPCSYAYRRGIGVHDALAKVAEYRDRGLIHILRADINHFFDNVDHSILKKQLEVFLADKDYEKHLDMIFMWLKTPVFEASQRKPTEIGLLQGLPISPLLANFYLTPFDRKIIENGWKMIRYADDLIVCTESEGCIEHAQNDMKNALVDLHLDLNDHKTIISNFEKGFTFLGAHFLGDDILPAVKHPYEAEFKPPPKPKKSRSPEHVPLKYAPSMRTLYIQEQGSQLGCHGNRFVVTYRGSTLIDISFHFIEQIFIFGRIQITSAAMSMCLYRNIPLYLFSGKGSYYGSLKPVPFGRITLREKQYAATQDFSIKRHFAKSIVKGKINNYKNFLLHFGRNHPDFNAKKELKEFERLLSSLNHAKSMDHVRGYEGAATSAYYRALSKMIRTPFYFYGRNKRPPTDPVNGLLSFGYTLLFYNIYSYICARELDPDLGIFHCIAPGHHSLASDLIEEFRVPVVDSLVVSICNKGIMTPDDFYYGKETPQPCLMKDPSRKRYIEQFENKMSTLITHPDSEDQVDWRRCIDLQVMRFSRFIEGKIKDYVPYNYH